MNVVHVDTGREMRGGQYQALLLLQELRSRSHHCTLLAPPESPLAARAARVGFRVYPAGIIEVWRHSRGADVIHAHDARAHTLAAVAAQTRFVVSRRVSFPVRSSVLSKIKYRRAARYLAISRYVKRRLEEAGIPASVIDVVYDAAERKIQRDKDAARGPIVAPAYTNDPKKLSTLAKQACEMVGVPLLLSDDLVRDLPTASALLYLSESEGLGSAALLAMAGGVPVIASQVEGMAEIFVDGLSGIYVHNEDVRGIAKAVSLVRSAPDYLTQLGKAGLALAQERFTPDKMAAGTLASYERALA